MEAYWEEAKTSASGAVVYGEDETLLLTSTGVSVYHGKVKARRGGTALLTTHRIVWVDDVRKPRVSVALPLRHVEGVSWKRGFIGMSSPKILVYLGDLVAPKDGEAPAKAVPVR